MLHWDPTLGNPAACFVPAKLCTQHTGVLDSEGHPKPTPQRLFVDDSVYAEVFQALRTRLEQAIACGIEAIFILLGQSDLKKRQDPISFAKMVEMMISHLNKILGQLINTRIMEVQVPPTYITLTLRKLKPFHQGRKSFTVKEMETTTGMLVFISSTAPWLKFLMSHIYVSIAAAIGSNTAHLRRTNKQFRQLLKDARAGREPTRENTFSQLELAKAIHSCPRKHFINITLQQELHLITTALQSRHLKLGTPIGHLVHRDPSASAWSGSCLFAAGGYSTDMKFWWYIAWPDKIKSHTLVYVRNNKDRRLVSINVLEYAALLINYAAAYHFYLHNPDPADPYPQVLFYANNTASKSLMVKACNSSLIRRALSRLQCAMMINNKVGIRTDHVTTVANIIADRLLHIEHETHCTRDFLSLVQDFPALAGCKRFHPSAELASHITDAILQKKFINPMEVNQSILKNPGHLTS